MAFKFFNIGKANAEIERLETELASFKENSTTVEGTAEKLQADLITAQSGLTKSQKDLTEANTKLTKAETDLAASVSKQADFDAKVEAAASKKAVDIAASVGVPALPNKPAESPAAATEEKPKLFGFSKVKAAFATQK